jgi:uncharacterized membrane protein/ElaB/YqjD/DUF883 family membrane-anchored ribosome-binding protein
MVSGLALLVLTTNFKDGASIGLEMTRKLDHEGWIEVMDFTLVEKDEKGRVSIRRSDDEILEKVSAAAVGISGGGMAGALGASAGDAAAASAGASIGVAEQMESVEHEQLLQSAIPANLPQNSSALAVLIEERYAERLEEKFETIGRTVIRSLNRAECDAELHAYLHRSHNRISCLEEDIRALSAALRTCSEAEKIRLQGELAAKQSELRVARDKLMDHIEAMTGDLYTEIREMNARLALAGRAARPQLAACVDHLQRELDELTDQLEDLIEDRIEVFNAEASELRSKSSKAVGELKAALEAHGLYAESLLRKERDELGDSFEQRLLQTKQWFQVLRVRSAFTNAAMRAEQRDAIEKAQRALEEVKARVRMRHRDEEGAWKHVRLRFNSIWRELAEAFDASGAQARSQDAKS